jgi:hypothetical protein
MKKIILGVFAVFAMSSLVSCGGGMGAEEIEAKAKERFDKDQAELEAQATADCETNTPMYVQQALDSISTANAVQ